MPETDTTETVATFEMDGVTYEIDHLGICRDSQWGEFAIWRDGEQVGAFAIEEALLKPEHRPSLLPVSDEELVRLAKEALPHATPTPKEA